MWAKTDKNNYVIYMHINKINNKKYIGCTCQIPENRWADGKGYEHNQVFNNDIIKYGWDNFEHIILEQHLTKGIALAKEEALIIKYNTTDSKFGYNLRCKNNNNSEFTSKRREIFKSEEFKKKISDTSKGRVFSEEHKQKIRESNLGKKRSKETIEKIKLSKTNLSEESKKKMSKSRKGKIYINNGDKCFLIYPNELDKYLKQGYVTGRKNGNN